MLYVEIKSGLKAPEAPRYPSSSHWQVEDNKTDFAESVDDMKEKYKGEIESLYAIGAEYQAIIKWIEENKLQLPHIKDQDHFWWFGDSAKTIFHNFFE